MNDFVLSDILRVPISYIIKGAYFLVPNYAIALLLFAIAVKILLFPLSVKQQKNLVKQAKLQPKVDAIRKRYAGRTDQATQQKMNQETMDLYQKEKFNPLGGCLPMLIQLPILFSLYNVINDPLKYLCNLSSDAITAIGNKINELYAAFTQGTITADIPEAFLSRLSSGNLTGIEKVNAIRYFGEGNFAQWLDGVTLPDFSLFGLDLSATPQFSFAAFSSLSAFLLFLIPILSGVIAFFSMKLNKKLMPQPQQADQPDGMGASMKMMDWLMPAMSVWISFSLPAVIGVYWIYQNALGTVQQVILKKMYPAPVYTEEERREIERQMNGKVRKDPAKKNTTQSGDKPKVRSLHHIDDEDFPDSANAIAANANKGSKSEPSAQKKKSPVADLIVSGALKDDARDYEAKDKEEK